MKHMKKSMFITTIVMVAVLVVALSTSTFAWYTAQSNVSATNTTLTAANSNSASLGLDTSNNGYASTYSSVTLTLSTEVSPMIPTTAFGSTTTYDSAAFTTAPIDNAGLFTSEGSSATAAKIATAKVGELGAVTQDYFYIVNTNNVNNTGYTIAVTIKTSGYTLLSSRPADFVSNYGAYYTQAKNDEYLGEGDTVHDEFIYTALSSAASWETGKYYMPNSIMADKLRVAVFANNKYISTWTTSNGSDVYYGAITNGSAASSITTKLATASVSASGTAVNPATVFENAYGAEADLATLSGSKIQVLAWFEGGQLTAAQSGFSAVFTIEFAKVAAQG